jgi:hypothetical protein
MKATNKGEFRHREVVDRKMFKLRSKEALRSEWEQAGVYRSPYLKDLITRINNLKTQLKAMGALE